MLNIELKVILACFESTSRQTIWTSVFNECLTLISHLQTDRPATRCVQEPSDVWHTAEESASSAVVMRLSLVGENIRMERFPCSPARIPEAAVMLTLAADVLIIAAHMLTLATIVLTLAADLASRASGGCDVLGRSDI